jgi:hypothetical protein
MESRQGGQPNQRPAAGFATTVTLKSSDFSPEGSLSGSK